VSTDNTIDIEALIQEGFLAPEAFLGYQCTLGQDMLALNFGEIMFFVNLF
jgi:hypothetical protein